MTAADFRRIALSLEGVEEYPHAGVADFSCKRQEIFFARLASTGLRESDAYAGAAGGDCGRGARDFSGDAWRLVKDGTHAYSLGGERGCTDGRTSDGLETAN